MKYLICLLFIFFFPLIHADSNFYFDFSESEQGWIGDFADYPVGEEAFYELNSAWTTLPQPLPNNESGIILSGNNHSDDLMMFIKNQISGLQPNTEYDLSFRVTIETDIPSAELGVGGSPGEDVFFKVGASSEEPVKIIKENYYRLNIDVGIQGSDGTQGIIIGNLANPDVEAENPSFFPKTMENTQSLKAKTDSHGQLWLFVGTDSAFEGITTYYIANIEIIAKEAV